MCAGALCVAVLLTELLLLGREGGVLPCLGRPMRLGVSGKDRALARCCSYDDVLADVLKAGLDCDAGLWPPLCRQHGLTRGAAASSSHQFTHTSSPPAPTAPCRLARVRQRRCLALEKRQVCCQAGHGWPVAALSSVFSADASSTQLSWPVALLDCS